MGKYIGKIGNSKISKRHSSAIGNSKNFFKALSKAPFNHRVKLGIISPKKPKSYFINCTVYNSSLAFKIGFTGVQFITVTVGKQESLVDLLKYLREAYTEVDIKINNLSDYDLSDYEITV